MLRTTLRDRRRRAVVLTFAAGLAACAGQHSAPPKTPAATSTQAPTPQAPETTVVRHATVLPSSGPVVTDGAVAFSEGKLVFVGKDSDVPTFQNAKTIEARGRFVTPGLIDGHSHLGVGGSPEVWAHSDFNEGTAPVTAEVSAAHGFWPQDPGLRRAAAGGITSLLALPGSANLIGGRGFPVKLKFGRTASEMRFPGAKDSLKMACGENPKRVYGKNQKRSPSTRMGNVAGYRQAFAQAQDYAAKRKEYDNKLKKNPDGAGVPPTRDLKNETLAAVMNGDLLVQNHCYRADEMQIMLEVADEFGFTIRAFHHALEAYKLRDKIVVKNTAIATWADWWGFKFEAYDGIRENAGLFTEAGGRATIHSDSEIGIQRLNQEAAKALWRARDAGISVTEEQALRWITLNPAWLMGVDNVTGSLEKGKMADLVVWDRTPLSVYAKAEKVFADGVQTYDAKTGASNTSDFELSARAEVPIKAAEVKLPPAIEAAKPGDPAPLPIPDKADACTVIRGAAVLAESGILESGSVVLRGGRIASVGKEAGDPAGCRVVEGAGRVLAPGFIEPNSHLGVMEITYEESTKDTGPRESKPEDAVHAALRASENVNPESEALPVARGGGITSAVTIPGAGLVSGQSAHFSLDGRVLKPSIAMYAALGESGAETIHSSRGDAMDRLKEVLSDAREYAKRRQEFEQNRMRKVAASRGDLEALQPVLAGRMPLVVRVDRASDIRAALALKKEFGLRLVLSHAAEAWKVAAELAQAKVPVIVRPMDNLPANMDVKGARMDAAALLSAQGVSVLISTFGDPQGARTLPQEAGNAVAWGLEYSQAIRAISTNVADAFGLEGGRIAAGARADLVLWNGDPLELSSRPVGMWIGGAQVPLDSRQTKLLGKYRKL
ncbi:MAG: amidohydrolase family protein [Elusimicrobia bacterium]|nr:amidohydrolase family protein [Elusimicrobiota bacterium]